MILRSMRQSPSCCRPSQYLEDFGLKHEDLKSCDEELDERLAVLVRSISKRIEIAVLRKELERKVSGIWWCTII